MTAHQYADDTAFSTGTSTNLKDDITAGRTIKVKVKALPKGGFIDITYTAAVVQYTADTVDIIGEFKASGASGESYRRASRVEVEITNVADGSGSVTMSTGSSPAYTARAGSTDNTITSGVYSSRDHEWRSSCLGNPRWLGVTCRIDDADDPNHVTVRTG